MIVFYVLLNKLSTENKINNLANIWHCECDIFPVFDFSKEISGYISK